MKHIRLFFIVICAAFTASFCHAQTGWNQLPNIPPISSKGELYDLFFVDAQKGFVLVDDQMGGHLFRTTDGGNSWENILLPTTGYFTRMTFLNQSVGIIGGFTGHTTIFLRTSDGGNSWVKLPYDSAGQIYYALTSVDSLYCFAGTYFSGTDSLGKWIEGSLFFKSSDGGLTWTSHRVDPVAIRDCSDITFADRNRGLMILIKDYAANGGDGILYRTIDGGENWEEIPLYDSNGQYIRWYGEVTFIKDKIWLVTAGDGTYKTIDDGTTWYRFSDTILRVKKVYRGEMCYAFTGTLMGGDIFKSLDGGSNWVQQSHIDHQITHFFIVNRQVAYAVGWGHTLLKTTDGGGTFAVLNLPHFFSEISVTPNPSFDNITFSFSSELMPQALIITDVLGREAGREMIPPNTTSYTLDIRRYPAGAYYVRIGSKTSRFVKM